MSHRASLKGCVNLMGVLFAQERYDKLAIIANDAGKYYTLLTPGELEVKTRRSRLGADRLILHCTRGEFRSIIHNAQTNMFPELTGRQEPPHSKPSNGGPT